MPIEYNTPVYSAKLQELEILNDIPGLSKFWHFVRGLINNDKKSVIVFKPKLPEEIGGFVARHSNYNFVVIARENLVNGNLKFKNLTDAAVFIHELCHWIHYNYLDYKYSSGNPLVGKKALDYKKSKTHRFYIELEAWNLSRKFGKLYGFSNKLLKAIDKCNANNMKCVLEMCNNTDSPFDENNNKIKKDFSELSYEDYVLDEKGKFHLPKLEVSIE